MTIIPEDRRERFRNRFKSNAGELLAADPVCNGRVCSATVEMLAEHALSLAESAISGDRLDRSRAKRRR